MFSYLRHLLVPHQRNNHRAKILHNSSLFFLSILFLFSTTLTILVNSYHPEVLGVSYSISDSELLNLVNYERGQRGLSALSLNGQLSQAAAGKASHMFSNNYWAHFAPDGTSPWGFIKGAGYNYLYAGENLAKGFTNSSDVVNAWMNSPTHRENLLSPQFKDVGFSISSGTLQGEETVLIVQMFGATTNTAFAPPQSVEAPTVPAQVNSVPQITIIPTPTPFPTLPVQGIVVAQNITPKGYIEPSSYKFNPIIDAIFGTKVITFGILVLILIALITDFMVVEKNRIPRIVGNNIDHILLISLFLVFILISRLGTVI